MALSTDQTCDCERIVILGDASPFITTTTDSCGNTTKIIDLRELTPYAALKAELAADPVKARELFVDCILGNFDDATRKSTIRQLFDTTTLNTMWTNNANGCRVGENEAAFGQPDIEPIANL